MDESILNHLFLPHHLPSSADSDFLTKGKHENEYKLLECMTECFKLLESADATNKLSIFSLFTDCIERWSVLQNPQGFSVSNIQSAIEQLPLGGFLPLYFHAQNAAILIEIDKIKANQPLISAWQVALPAHNITSSLVPNNSSFPVTTYRLHDRSQLSAKAHCELLMDFMYNSIEHSKSYKSSREVNEIRDVSESHYVCQWWIQHFDGTKIEQNSSTYIEFTKKHRDQIRWNNALLPFRRSGLWMVIKVVLHTILIKRLGDIGNIVYKVLITYFLTYIICTRHISTDLLVHCSRKIVRRLNKIEGLLSVKVDSNDVIQWIRSNKREIESKINEVITKLNQQNTLRMNTEKNTNSSMINLKLNHSDIHRHSCQELKAYLNKQNSTTKFQVLSNINSHDVGVDVNQADYIPSIKVFTNKFNYTIDIALIRIETWVESCLEQWINRPIASQNERNRFEILLDFFEEYYNAALDRYCSARSSTNPIGYSQLILTSLTLIRSMHQNLCKDSRFERLKLHSIDIPKIMNLFEYLSLPNREDMVRARSLHGYFDEFSRQTYPDLLTNIESVNAFGVYYASQSSTMNDNIRQIRVQAERDKLLKIKEVQDAKQKYEQLINSIRNLSCTCEHLCNRVFSLCDKCRIKRQADSISVEIFECPMPSAQESALAVIFELQMPIEIRCYRDILWQFVNRPNPNPSHNMYKWLTVPPHKGKLGPFYSGPDKCKVELVSSTKSITQSHYSNPSIVSSVERFLFENSLKVAIPPTKPSKLEDECRILTFQLDHPHYKQLQFTLDTTQFVQNDVIAQLSHCPPQMKPTQFVEFGSFRSGHRLQWWNLLTIFEMDSLSIGEESVAILIIHSILQNGPLTTNENKSLNPWCPESCQHLLEHHFVDELFSRLDHHLDNCELNWQNELVLIVITMVTMKILTVCYKSRADQVANLAKKCRRVGEKWIHLISTSIQSVSPSALSEVKKLREKMVNIGICCLMTFSTHEDRIKLLLSSNEHVLSLLKAATTVQDNIILNGNMSTMSTFMNNMMKFSERVLITLQPTIAKFLQETSYQSLNDFATIYWAVIRGKSSMNGQWKKRKADLYDGWYDCQYESRHVSIDCIRGMFLVDEMTIGFLPQKITSNELFARVFGNYIFEVQAAESPHTYVTKQPYHNERVFYEFRFDDQINRLIINERHLKSNNVFQLIPHHCFEKELPDTFVVNHSHWYNAKDRQLEFRPVRFQNVKFLDDKPNVLSMDTGYITTTHTDNTQCLINQASVFFQNLFSRYFIRLDGQSYVYMMRDTISQLDIIIHIHLSRLGIAFQYNDKTKTITSREYSDMCVAQNQRLETLTGLTSGLLLSPLTTHNHILESYPYQKLIVPFGNVCSSETLPNSPQTVAIQRSSSTLYPHQYFVFVLNERLRILQSTDSPTGWLYLALLHAMTSHPLPDQYTGMTGMERSFQLLNSAGCRSDQPFDAISLNILTQIASISPKVNYYPQHLTCMINIYWNTNGLPYSMQHFGYYLITKHLIDASQKLNFMYPSLATHEIPALFQNKAYDEVVLKKLYWDYRDSYNPMARLFPDMEADIQRTLVAKRYESASEHFSHAVNYSALHLANDMYATGRVNLRDFSIQNWLPLSKWVDDENGLKDIWIGLLKWIANSKNQTTRHLTDDTQRFITLIDFLHYISKKCNIQPFYLQMLKIALKIPTISLQCITFPPFISYQNIEEISVTKARISFPWFCTSDEENEIVLEIENCFVRNRNYETTNKKMDDYRKNEINSLLTSWQNNKQLRSFVETVQKILSSVNIETFSMKVTYHPQKFGCELIENHHHIQVKLTENSINQKILHNAQLRFHHTYRGHFNKPNISLQADKRQNAFPQDIFPSINNQNDHFSELTNYFKNQLNESWTKLLSKEQIEKVDPSVDELIKLLKIFQEESTESWNELVKSITLSNKQLFDTGLVLRITRTTLISLLQQKLTTLDLTEEQRTLLGGILVSWTLEQQLERALHFCIHQKLEDFRKEISNIPHSNWIPSKYVSWLIFELEMNITIRNIQIEVAQHMMQHTMTINDSTVKSIVMQMNMGEGKTSVILPMLAVSLCSSHSSLVRIIVLKSLFPTNYQSLRYKLGGLLNRRIFPFSCRRDLNYSDGQINQISNRLKQALDNCDVILTSPEDILSFDLLTIDKCRRKEFSAGCSMLTLQRWLKANVRDVLDESDEILHVKYQLIYTVGGQQQVDGGAQRWKTIQSILELVKKYASHISRQFNKEVCYKSAERKSAFPQFRLQSHLPFSTLCKKIANDWLNQKSYRQVDKQIVVSFILQTYSSIECLEGKFSQNDILSFLIVRGLLSSEVLLVALKKRHRVNYGVNPNPCFNRLMAVPFRAKDVAADRTEFGHPDVALVLTYFTYYYSGLNDLQLIQCFGRLSDEESDPASIYNQWISNEEDDNIPSSIKQWKGVNLKDYHQRIHDLFPTLRYNMLVINYFLNHFVFPREAKQFPSKLVASAWDLSSSLRSKNITGFSGTNDTQLLLPIHIRQYDLPELQQTDAIVVNNLLQPENDRYQSLPINVTSEEILKRIINNKEKINVILDVGALFVDGSNREIAVQWLNMSSSSEIEYVVYFDSDSIVVYDRQCRDHPFITSPASERLDRCIFYLDDIHTRGTDFKFPREFRAAVTLGNGLTKDRFVQACMRMRKLGNGHSLIFLGSHEVHQQIIKLTTKLVTRSMSTQITVRDILRWVYENTVQSTWEGLHHWAAQSLSFQRKIAAFQYVDWNNHQQEFTTSIMEKLARDCLEPEVIHLREMYGASKILQTIFKLHSARYRLITGYGSREIQDAVLKRLIDYGGTKQRLSQLLDEEQQRELEQELEEERHIERSPSVEPYKAVLHEEIKRLCDMQCTAMNLAQFPHVFRPLAYAFTETTWFNDCQQNSWQSNLWVSTEFQRVITTKGTSLNSFLRPPRWLLVYRNRHFIFINALEANWLMGKLKTFHLQQQSDVSSITTLRLLLPRTKQTQSIFVNTPSLTIPPTIDQSNTDSIFNVSLECLVQLFVFNGTLYFETKDEQNAFCHCLSLCPKPRTKTEEQAFENGWIGADGYVSDSKHRNDLKINQARFVSNPLKFIKEIIENRNNSHASISSHVGSIIFNAFKLV
ncbi:unnamed protein product [Adineta steineri]|uniref:ubiquitinyl hydrolase 1 n=1 Tax=Adineta steineri TaxID=433720 RepID=A0A815CW11_9BILA|nr:unnamed protein product [Adineta steineri]CAF1204181.1 unnamed protein product [Adineta steineri]CAF1288155.1 unnamed protein product [Adineta steineri]